MCTSTVIVETRKRESCPRQNGGKKGSIRRYIIAPVQHLDQRCIIRPRPIEEAPGAWSPSRPLSCIRLRSHAATEGCRRPFGIGLVTK